MADPKREWTYIPPAWSGRQVEGTGLLPFGRYQMPDGSEQVSFGLPQPMLDAVRAMGYAGGREQDPAAPEGYVSQNAMMKGGMGLAESALVGSLGARAPKGSMRMFGGRYSHRNPEPMVDDAASGFKRTNELIRQLNTPSDMETPTLYHSGTAADADAIRKGLEPRHGPWISEIARNATNDPNGLLSQSPELAWLSSQPDWIIQKVRRATGKQNVTVDDVKKHGHLSVFRPDEYDEVFRVGDEGLEGPDTMVRTPGGEDVKFWETPLYETSDSGHWASPFGVERNEWITRDAMTPEATLTGNELVHFMDQTNPNWRKDLLAANPLAGAVPLAWKQPQQEQENGETRAQQLLSYYRNRQRR